MQIGLFASFSIVSGESAMQKRRGVSGEAGDFKSLLPVPPRPLWSGDQMVSAFFGRVE
jgi:hypothetical protein